MPLDRCIMLLSCLMVFGSVLLYSWSFCHSPFSRVLVTSPFCLFYPFTRIIVEHFASVGTYHTPFSVLLLVIDNEVILRSSQSGSRFLHKVREGG